MIHAQKTTTEPDRGVSRMAELLDVSRSGYYAWAARQRRDQPGPRARRRTDLTVKIRVAHDASDGVYGSPRIVADLREGGEVVSRKTVAKLMAANGIGGISPRPWRPVTTIADQNPHTIPDLVARRFDRGALNKVWTSDIPPQAGGAPSYLDTGQGWLYLCAVRDGCSRRVLGYAFADSLHTDVVEAAVRRAVTFRGEETGPTATVIFHADRGCQYTSTQLADVAREVDVRLSMGRTGVCWDNAQQESFWSTLKTEYYERFWFDTHAEAITGVSTWIGQVYNRARRHSSLRQISPVTFEHQLTTAVAQAA